MPNDPKPKVEEHKGGDASDLYIAAAVTGIVYLCLIVFSVLYQDGTHFTMCLLSGLLGSVLGWVIGIIISPYEASEKEAFASIGKLVYGFLTGYVVSKLDPVITSMLQTSGNEPPKFPFIYMCVALVAFLASAAVTYISRSYWRGPPAGGTAT